MPGESRPSRQRTTPISRNGFGARCRTSAYDVSVNVVFLGGADFESPPPLGTTDRTRYVKVTTLEEAQGPELQKWIVQAGHTPGWT